MIDWPDLRGILEPVPWAIVGGVATRAYMPERMTQDLDILVALEDGPEARRRLEGAGFEVVSPLSIPGIVLRSPAGVEIDDVAPRRRDRDQPQVGQAFKVFVAQ